MSAHVSDLPDTSAGSLPVSERHPGRPLAEAPGEGDEAPDGWSGVAVAGRWGRTERQACHPDEGARVADLAPPACWGRVRAAAGPQS
jgi:hypothetical protein